MLLSIVIPSCGREELACAIESCLRQEVPAHASIEILLVDNTVEGRLQTIAASYGDRVRHVPEPERGVSQARNAGVRVARGSFIAFLDDDEEAALGWAAALIKHAEAGNVAVFGPVVPSFAEPPGTLNAAALRLFQRHFDLGDGADLTEHYAYLGTGNSLFHRSCFTSDKPFSVALGNLGGEDAAFIRMLVHRGIRLTWAAHAAVIERVPGERLKFSSMAIRHFRQGQIRSIVRFCSPGLGKVEGLGWMAIGLAQVLLYGAQSCALAIVRADRARLSALKVMSGLGKIFWQSPFWRLTYGKGMRNAPPRVGEV